MITEATAVAIAYAYREIETAEKLLADIKETTSKQEAPDIRDVFGRRPRGLELGVPSGPNAKRLFNVEWSLAEPVIVAHIGQQRAKLLALMQIARVQLALTAVVVAPPAQEG